MIIASTVCIYQSRVIGSESERFEPFFFLTRPRGFIGKAFGFYLQLDLVVIGSLLPHHDPFSNWLIHNCSLRFLDSLGVMSSGSGLKAECADIFHQSPISGCYAILTSPQKSETAVYGYNPALFWVLPVSCWCLAKLIFTQPSALQYSACRI